MAWSPIPHPYQKYVYEDPNAYTSVDPDLIKSALAGAGLDDTSAQNIFSNWQSMMGLGGAGGTGDGSGSGGSGPIDFRALIENDPFYRQAKADMSAQGVEDAASRAQAIKRTLIDWGMIPDFKQAADKLGLSQTALGFINSDLDPRAQELAAQNEKEGLSMHSRLEKSNTDNIAAIRNALAARGMYQSGELGHGLTENAQQYKQASTDAEKQVLGNLEEVSGRYVQAERDRQRQLAEAMMAAAQRAALTAGSTGSGTGTSTGGNGTSTGGNGTQTGTTNPGPGQIGWDPVTRTPSAGTGLAAGTYTVNGEQWTYDPTRGWTRGVPGPTGSDGSVPYYAPRPTRGVAGAS